VIWLVITEHNGMKQLASRPLQYKNWLPGSHLVLKISVIYNSNADSLVLFTFSYSCVLWLSGYILSRLSMLTGSNVGGLTYLYLHLYNQMMNLADHCFFPYLANFMVAVARLAVTNSTSSCSLMYILHLKLPWSTILPQTLQTRKIHCTMVHKCSS